MANFSTKIRPLIDTEIFSLSNCAKRAFETLKKDLGDVTLMSIDEDRNFVLETDVSNVAISLGNDFTVSDFTAFEITAVEITAK